MAVTDDSGTKVARGEVKLSGASTWSPVTLQLIPRQLVVLGPNGVGGTWGFSDIVSVEESGPPSGDIQTIVASMRGGAELSLKAPNHFVDVLVERLIRDRDLDHGVMEAPRAPIALPLVTPPTPDLPTVIDLRQVPPAAAAAGPVAPAFDHRPPPMPQWGPPPTTAVRTEAATDSSNADARRRLSVPRLLALAVGAMVVVGAVVGAVVFRGQAQEMTEQAELANDQLDSTKQSLTDTEEQLAAVSTERDDLTQRVTELSNEKAQVQDERNASRELSRLGAIAAQQMLDCRNQLLDVMSSMLTDSIYSVNAQLDAVVPVCQEANSSVAAFSDAAGG